MVRKEEKSNIHGNRGKRRGDRLWRRWIDVVYSLYGGYDDWEICRAVIVSIKDHI